MRRNLYVCKWIILLPTYLVVENFFSWIRNVIIFLYQSNIEFNFLFRIGKDWSNINVEHNVLMAIYSNKSSPIQWNEYITLLDHNCYSVYWSSNIAFDKSFNEIRLKNQNMRLVNKQIWYTRDDHFRWVHCSGSRHLETWRNVTIITGEGT